MNPSIKFIAGAIAIASIASSAYAEEVSVEQAAKNENVKYLSQEVEPAHHLVLSTDHILVRDVLAVPETGTDWHLHDHDVVMVNLQGSDVPQQIPGIEQPKHRIIETGAIYYKPYASNHFIHKITNVGKTDFRIIEIALLKEKLGVTLDQLNDGWKQVIDNDRVRVSKVSIAPNSKLETVAFKGPHLFLATSDGSYAVGDLQMQIKQGTPLVDYATGSKILNNKGNKEMDLVIVELK